MTAAETDTGSDRLLALYRAYIGEPDSRTDVYLGFAMFFGGLGLGLVGLLLFVLERGVVSGEVFWLREVAFVVGALGLPVVLVSVVVLLPSDRRATYVAGVGFAVTLVALAFFVVVYPSNWNHGTPDYSLQGVTVYAVGLISVLAATGSALVGYHIERARGGPAVDDEHGDAASAAGGGEDPAATEAQVQRDIEEAMAETEISWGGVERVETEQLQINPDAELAGETLDRASASVYRSSSVDEQLDKLRGLQGGEQRTDSGTGIDDQAAALKELRQQQQQDADAGRGRFIDRLRSYVDR